MKPDIDNKGIIIAREKKKTKNKTHAVLKSTSWCLCY